MQGALSSVGRQAGHFDIAPFAPCLALYPVTLSFSLVTNSVGVFNRYLYCCVIVIYSVQNNVDWRSVYHSPITTQTATKSVPQ